jgi:dipeptidyl aminopeptidase/acylaminoacyl peptidase
MLKKLALFLLAVVLYAQAPAPFTAPPEIDYRRADIWSEGTRMSAELFSPKSLAGKKLPTIVMAHGWGGVKASLRPDAVLFAKSGYLVLTFDYRGWGDSDSRIAKFKGEQQDVREVVDPLDFGTDWLNAIHFVAGEPQCDMTRLGLWGSSFSGGLVVWAAERDPRVKVVHSQVGSLDGRFVVMNDRERSKTYEEATKMARGEMSYPQPGAKVLGNLKGAPVRARFMNYMPVEELSRAPRCAMQFVIAGKEELFDNKDHALKAYERVQGPKNLVTIPNITHYGIYYEARKEAQRLALEWYDKHLK